MRSIFSRVKLKPGQLRAVAERRFADAQVLRETGKSAHANGAMYLAGFVIECLLKAKLLERFSWLQFIGSVEQRTKDEKRLWSLCYRSHDLDEILDRLPRVKQSLEKAEPMGSLRLFRNLKNVCAEWTIYARYSPQSAKIN